MNMISRRFARAAMGIALFTLALPVLAADNAQEALEWKDCVALAKKNHPLLQSSREKVNQAKANTGITRSAMLPQVNAGVNAARSKQENPSGYGDNSATDTYSYSLSGNQLLFDGGKSIYDVKSAKKNVMQSEYAYDATSSQIRMNLRAAFVQLLKAQEGLLIAKDIAERRKQNLELVRMRYMAGREHRGSLLTAEANLSSAESDVSQMLRTLSLAQRSLVKEMGLNEFRPLIVKGNLESSTIESVRPDFEKLAASNPSLKVAIVQREAAEYNLKSAEAAYFPGIYANANVGRADTKWPPANNQWSVGIGVTLPLVEGGKRIYQVSQAKAVYNQLLADERNTRSVVLMALEQKWVNWRYAVDNADVQRKYLSAAQERAKIAEAQYSIGVILFDNWIIIEDSLVSIKKSYLDAEAVALTSEAEWLQAKGETLDYDR